MPRGVKGSGRPAYKSRAKRRDEAVTELNNAVSALEEIAGYDREGDADEDGFLAYAQEKIEEAEGLLANGHSQLEELRDEMEEWRSNMEEKLSHTDKYSRVEECAQALESAVDFLESIELPEVPLPPEKGSDKYDEFLAKYEEMKVDFLEEYEDRIQEAINEISDGISEAENADFPGMYG